MEDNLQAVREFISENIEIEEFKLLRLEIMYYNEAAFRTEVFAIAACGIVWGWIVVEIEKLDTVVKLGAACALPLLLLIAGYTRYNALKYRVKRLAHYVYCIERKHFSEKSKTAGWEHFVAVSRPNDYTGALNDSPEDSVTWRNKCVEFKNNPDNYKFGFFEKWANRTWLAALAINGAALFFAISLSR